MEHNWVKIDRHNGFINEFECSNCQLITFLNLNNVRYKYENQSLHEMTMIPTCEEYIVKNIIE